ncbi:uncharacterized protein LOC105915826 [Fundulus heteroclitus]|uniref:uncharacterized protein LOC105915826 n=1 Tax=Fundulus heteroclitus TaxID=8078 RepID=UPI00165BB739|nr:uncharacterized protein LOC105915826 [Fundulus heteroclitus]
MAAFLLWLLSLGFLAFPSHAETYDNLPETYKKGVDLALEKVNAHTSIRHHFLFFSSVEKNEFEGGFEVSFIYHHFHLKATNCEKGTVDSSRCKFRKDRPLIDCAVCYKTFRGEIEEEPAPYIHCVHKPVLTEDMKTTRIEKCNALGYSSGTPSLLLVTGTNG